MFSIVLQYCYWSTIFCTSFFCLKLETHLYVTVNAHTVYCSVDLKVNRYYKAVQLLNSIEHPYIQKWLSLLSGIEIKMLQGWMGGKILTNISHYQYGPKSWLSLFIYSILLWLTPLARGIMVLCYFSNCDCCECMDHFPTSVPY